MNLSNAAILEISTLSDEAETLARGSARDRAQSAVLLQRIANIRQVGISSDEMRGRYVTALTDSITKKPAAGQYRALFDRLLVGNIDADGPELRDFFSGTQSIAYTQGAAGGYIVPVEYDPTVYEAMAQVSPMTDKEVVNFTMTDSASLQPSKVSGYDLSTLSASIIGEGAQQVAQAIPPVAGGPLRSDIIFKISLAASLEAEMDVPDFGAKIVRAVSVALARRVGRSVLQGKGGADINGITNQFTATNIIKNATPGKIFNTDISAIFFAVDAFYRKQKKAGWLMDDASYKLVRNATDNQGRPLLDFQDEKLEILGKPVYVCPDLLTNAGFSLGNVGSVLFGDLDHIIVRASRPTVQRTTQQALTDLTRGESLYVGRVRADAQLFDPSSGSNPPVVMAAWN